MSQHLMGPGEIRDRLGGISRQRVYQITSDPTFPMPYDSLLMGKVWRIEDVESWILNHAHRRR
ncbi:DNA-binding protein [Paractinoplanes bogorensis]